MASNASQPGLASCNFTTRATLLSFLEEHGSHANASEVVATCEGVCLLVYGSGNPDISGPGAMVSYYIQFATMCIFGLLLGLYVSYMEYDFAGLELARRPGYRAVRALLNLARSACITNLFVSLAIAIASIVRYVQVPPVAELDFIKLLTVFQLLVSEGTAGCFILIFGFSAETIILGVLMSVMVSTEIAILFIRALPPSQLRILQTLTTYCVLDYDYPVPDNDFRSADRGDTRFFAIYFSVIVGVIALGGILYCYFPKRVDKVLDCILSAFAAACRYLGIRPKYHFKVTLVMFIALFWITLNTFLVLDLEKQRKALQAATAAAYQDSAWGFGQVTAVLMWAPLAHDFVMESIEYAKPEEETTANEVIPLLAHDAENDASEDKDDLAGQPIPTSNSETAPESTHNDDAEMSINTNTSTIAVTVTAGTNTDTDNESTINTDHETDTALASGVQAEQEELDRPLTQRSTWPRWPHNESYMP